ncbi:MAG: LD-carboxypeptidase [Firmicutes bacterium]|nr:LD-carboxypeptidase [Bacillota bacterium]
MIAPAPLNPGDTAALVAPASPLTKDEISFAEESLKKLGLIPKTFAEAVPPSSAYVSAPDSLRAASLTEAFLNPAVKAVFCLRGGYGCSRLLPLLDPEVFRRNPKLFWGYSDITALHQFFNHTCNLITVHGPMPAKPSFLAAPGLISLLFEETLSRPGSFTDCGKPSLSFGEPFFLSEEHADARGKLTGGNLSVLCGLLGSPWEPDTDGRILFLEDVDEPPEKIDRNLTALRLAGKLQHCSALILGAFAGCFPSREQELSFFREHFADAPYPVLFGFPAGHIGCNHPLPMGAMVHLSRRPLLTTF